MAFSSLPKQHEHQQQQHKSSSTKTAAIALVWLLLATPTFVEAFHPIAITSVSWQTSSVQNRISSVSSRLYAENQKTTSSSTPAIRRSAPRPGEFELQELLVNLDSMRKQNVASRDLTPMKRLELLGYVERIVTSIDSPVVLSQLQQVLPGTKWRLQFSTQPLVGTDLPPDATITLTFHDDGTQKNSVMDYALEFSEKTFGLNAIKATSTYSVANDGLVTFVYDEIQTDAFGLKDIPTGFFGMLKGRANYIQSVYMNDKIWIERGYSSDPSTSSVNGQQQPYYNVYLRE